MPAARNRQEQRERRLPATATQPTWRAGTARPARASKETEQEQGEPGEQQGQGQPGQQGAAGPSKAISDSRAKAVKQGQGRDSQQGGQQQGGQGQGQQARPSRRFASGGGADRQSGRPIGSWRGPDGPGRPITGEGFRQWSDRMRDVEELLDNPELRAEAARIRDRARGAREEFKRHAKVPDWNS